MVRKTNARYQNGRSGSEPLPERGPGTELIHEKLSQSSVRAVVKEDGHLAAMF